MVSLECVWNVFFMNVHLQNYKNSTEEMLEKRSRKRACWKIQRYKRLVNKVTGVVGVQGQENFYKLSENFFFFFFFLNLYVKNPGKRRKSKNISDGKSGSFIYM